MSKPRLALPLFAALALLLGTGVSASPALAAGPPLAQGVAPEVLQDAVVFGTTPPTTPVTVSIVLRMQDEGQLAQEVLTDPRAFAAHPLGVAAFAQQYGQPTSVIQSLTAYLAGFGITTDVYPDHLVVVAHGDAGAFDAAFSVDLQDMAFGGRPFHGTRLPPRLPPTIASPILAVLGLTDYADFTDHAIPALKGATGTLPSTAGGVPVGLSPMDFATRYDVTPLYRQGLDGTGEAVGIVTLASFQPSDAFTFWQDVGASASPGRLVVVPVDGGPGAPSLQSGADETTLDVEQAGAVAPNARVVVYEAPNTDYGFADAFYQAVSQDQVDALSTSWGESEDLVAASIASGQEAPAFAAVFDQAFLEAAAEGISVFAASGDGGAYAAHTDLGTTDLSVSMPADSPFVTATGATTLPGTQDYGPFSVTIPSERTWAWDYLWPYWQDFGYPDEATWAESLAYGSGGGYSHLYATPSYQMAVDAGSFLALPYLTPIDQDSAWSFNPSPPLEPGTSLGRALPDLAADGDPQTGYAVYSTLFAPTGSDWAVYGGTSFVAPQMAAVATLIDQEVRARVGFWNPAIYAFASSPRSPFTPLDASGSGNDNLYYTGRAGALFNPGSGLGTPDVAALAADFGQLLGEAPPAGRPGGGPAAPLPPAP